MLPPRPVPRLRAVDCVVVPTDDGGRALLLRCTEGIAPGAVLVPFAMRGALARFDGRRTAERIAREATTLTPHRPIEARDVERLAMELDLALMLETPRFEAARERAVDLFRRAKVRIATHAGGAYHDDPRALRGFIAEECLSKAAPHDGRRVLGLCAPHMDLWRASEGYGHAYATLRRGGLAKEVDTVVLLGTSHAPMRRPFAVCDKAFDTPLGPLAQDPSAIAELRRRARFDLDADAYLHKNEHSLEFQAVFLRHALDDVDHPRTVRIVPILCGLGDAQSTRRDPSADAAAESFLDALANLVASRSDRILVIAGADLAHVGPRFGDPAPLDDRGRSALERRDRQSITHALARDASGFFHDVVRDLDTRRVCGLGPIYTLLRALPGNLVGRVMHYTQHVDPDEGSIVSHTSLSFS
jgi:hypothetical protein